MNKWLCYVISSKQSVRNAGICDNVNVNGGDYRQKDIIVASALEQEARISVYCKRPYLYLSLKVKVFFQ